MNTYAVPICDIDESEIWVKSIKARTIEEAKDKVINYIMSLYDIDFPLDWNEFIDETHNQNIYIGDIIDVELL